MCESNFKLDFKEMEIKTARTSFFPDAVKLGISNCAVTRMGSSIAPIPTTMKPARTG